MMDGRAVKLIIKAPNQQIKDQVVQCDVGWTVGRLKEYLTEVYPSKPERKSQKLIYSGQLLNDSIYLKDVLRQCEDQEEPAYTVHLVCTPQKTSVNKTILQKVQAVQNQTAASSTSNAAESATINTASNILNQSLDSNNVPAQTSQAQLFSVQYFDPHNTQQMAWMQQAYTHYFTQYMQLMAAQGIQLQTSIPYIQHMNINANESGQNHHTNNVNNNNGDDQVQNAAQPAAEDNIENIDGALEEGLNQDWLDVLYMFSRILLLISIVYFYSSPLRFFIVTFLGFVIYLYQGGFIRIPPAVQDNNNGRQDNNNQMAQHEVNEAQGATVQENEQLQTGQNEGTTNQNAVEERPGGLAFAWTFLISFFASLIPDDPNI